MDRVDTVLPMSDRRAVIAVLGVLTAALGLAMVLLALLALRHPIGSSGEIGTPTDFSALLVEIVWLGAALVVVGGVTAVALVRARLRPSR